MNDVSLQSDMRSLSIMASLPPATLPETYKNAQVALQNCAAIDECKEWANKAEALASYAKQAEDEELHNMARRIQLRAIDRCGELLKQIEAKQGANQNISIGGGTKVHTRKDAAAEAGLSPRQANTAIRMNNVPRPEFEAAVESARPPTVTALSDLGRKPAPKPIVDLGQRSPIEFEAATGLMGAVRELRRYADTADVALAASGLDDREAVSVLNNVLFLIGWLEEVRDAIQS